MKKSICVPGIAGLLFVSATSGCATNAPPEETGNSVMASKLQHAQAMLTAVVRADFEAVESNALALQAVSRETLLLPQDTVTYGVMADRFRSIAGALAARAAAKDLDGVMASYVELTRSCVGCHTRVHRERESADSPFEMSHRTPGVLDALVDAAS